MTAPHLKGTGTMNDDELDELMQQAHNAVIGWLDRTVDTEARLNEARCGTRNSAISRLERAVDGEKQVRAACDPRGNI